MALIRRLLVTLAASTGLVVLTAEAANAGVYLNHCPPTR